eukprot:scaffold292631_cov30-Tisochrysis_lutea.AAC.1
MSSARVADINDRETTSVWAAIETSAPAPSVSTCKSSCAAASAADSSTRTIVNRSARAQGAALNWIRAGVTCASRRRARTAACAAARTRSPEAAAPLASPRRQPEREEPLQSIVRSNSRSLRPPRSGTPAPEKARLRGQAVQSRARHASQARRSVRGVQAPKVPIHGA